MNAFSVAQNTRHGPDKGGSGALAKTKLSPCSIERITDAELFMKILKLVSDKGRDSEAIVRWMPLYFGESKTNTKGVRMMLNAPRIVERVFQCRELMQALLYSDSRNVAERAAFVFEKYIKKGNELPKRASRDLFFACICGKTPKVRERCQNALVYAIRWELKKHGISDVQEIVGTYIQYGKKGEQEIAKSIMRKVVTCSRKIKAQAEKKPAHEIGHGDR